VANGPRPKVLFPDQLAKPVQVEFDAESLTSDGGAPLLAALNQRVGLTSLLAARLVDRRDSTRVKHGLGTLLEQRIFGLALGYEDCNDAFLLRSDPGLKVALNRGLDDADDLASAATLCRFENAVQPRNLLETARALLEWRLDSLRRRFRKAKRVTIDLDSTPDPTHGQQRFAFYDGHYDTYSFKPLLVWLSFDDDPEQYLVATRLRPGTCSDVRTVIPLLRRLVRQVRSGFRRARVRVRADAGFGKNPRLLDALDELQVEYLLGLQPNSALKELSAPLAGEVERLRGAGRTGEEAQAFCEFPYRTQRSWRRERRVIAKAEITETEGREPKLNVRYVVAGRVGRQSPRSVYRAYRARGDAENRVKEIKQLELGRTSCSRYSANSFRVLLTTAAYMLFQELRWRLRATELHRADVNTFRTKLLKVAARVTESARRFVFRLPASYPWSRLWRRAALAVGAVPR
jgi:hypothetical protein